MNTEKKQLARDLYFQSGLNKTQIAGVLGISRRSLTYWIKEGNWKRIKTAATNLPTMLAENCYYIFGHLTERYLSERRLTDPVTPKEIDALHKLTLTIDKLKKRSTVNESMEMFTFFIEALRRKNERLAEEVMPYVDEYITERAALRPGAFMPDNFTQFGRLPIEETDYTEQQLDVREDYFSNPDIIALYAETGRELPSDEEIATLPPQDNTPPGEYDKNEEHKKYLAAMAERNRQRMTLREKYSALPPIEDTNIQEPPAETGSPENA